MTDSLSYKDSGVDIETADRAKRGMAAFLETSQKRVLNKFGAFASLIDGHFPELKHPVLVFKMEEPGSKQKLAVKHGRIKSICYDLVNHLIDDIIVMGAKPICVQDAIICGKLEEEVVKTLVKSMAEACAAQDCALVGGETSEQPGVLEAGTYILAASIIGVVDKAKIIDGARIKQGDVILALPSNGLHTNGYSLVRALIEKRPEILKERVGEESFLDAILKPHHCYYQNLLPVFSNPALHGLAHITGGGFEGNLNRILPAGVGARIDLSAVRVLPVFRTIKSCGQVPEADMRRTFNLGVGITAVVDRSAVSEIYAAIGQTGITPYQIGEIVAGEQKVQFSGALAF